MQVVWIKGHGHKRIVVLKNDMKSKYAPLPPLTLVILLLTFLSDGHSCLLDRLSSFDLFPVNHEDQPAIGRQILEVPGSHLASELQLGTGTRY